MSEPIRVMHVIGGLGGGGAEWMLYRLLRATDRERFAPSVVSLTPGGIVGERISDAGVPLRTIGLSRTKPRAGGFGRLRDAIHQTRPHVVQTWMYHSDLLGGLAAKLSGGVPVVWGVHHTAHDPATTSRRTLLIVRACTLTSRWLPRRIICCSEATRRTHERLGYPGARMIVIPNGFDTEEFSPSHADRGGFRESLGLPDETVLIGMLARYHPQKDHRTLIDAAALLPRDRPDVHFVLCGDGADAGNRDLRALLEARAVAERFHLLGRRDDVPRILASLDLVTSSSSGEAFPLVIGEAMASGTPVACTDVGDSRLIVGDAGAVVPPRNPAALAESWIGLLNLDGAERTRLVHEARARIVERFEIHGIAQRYAEIYREVAVPR